MDMLFINVMLFLATISEHLHYHTIEHIPNCQSSTYRSVIDRIFRLYNAAGFYIKKIRCDIEFKNLMEPIKDNLEIKMDYVPA